LQCCFDLWTPWHIWHIWHVLVRPQAGSKWKMYLQCLRSHECARTARIDGTGRTHILRPQLLKLQARTLPACVAKCTTLYYQLQQKQQKQVKNCLGFHSSRHHGWRSGVGGYSESPTISQRVDVGGRLEF
jgi:hypothetical protein